MVLMTYESSFPKLHYYLSTFHFNLFRNPTFWVYSWLFHFSTFLTSLMAFIFKRLFPLIHLFSPSRYLVYMISPSRNLNCQIWRRSFDILSLPFPTRNEKNYSKERTNCAKQQVDFERNSNDFGDKNSRVCTLTKSNKPQSRDKQFFAYD